MTVNGGSLEHLLRIVGRRMLAIHIEPFVLDDGRGWCVTVSNPGVDVVAVGSQPTLGEAVARVLDQLPPGLVEREARA